MRILQIVNSLTHTSIPIEMACEMLKTEDVEIAALYNTQEEADNFANEMHIGCKIYGFGYKRDKIKGLRNYTRFLKHNKYDIIHTHHALSGSVARFICYGKGSKLVHTVHANYHSYTKSQNLLIGSTFNRTDAIAFNSKSSQEGLYEWEKKKIKNVRQQVIYNGVNVERVQNASDSFWQEFCAENEMPDDAIVLTQIGRLEPVKNPMASLRAFEQLRNEIENETWSRLYFVYMGNGSEYKRMKGFVEEHGLDGKVILPGVIKRDAVYSWMKRADVIVIPSIYEGFCNTLFEALSLGKRIILSDIPVFNELLNTNLNVFRMNPCDHIAISTAMRMMIDTTLTSEDRQQELEVSMDFSLFQSIKRYINLYEELSESQY